MGEPVGHIRREADGHGACADTSSPQSHPTHRKVDEWTSSHRQDVPDDPQVVRGRLDTLGHPDGRLLGDI